MQYFLCPKCQFRVPANKHICQTCGYKMPSASEATGSTDGADTKARAFSKLFGFNASKQKDSQQEKPALG